MSQHPLPPAAEYVEPYATPPGRPTSVTVLAVLGIIFGAMGLLCTPPSLIPFFVDFGQPNPVLDAIKANNFLFFWTIASATIGILLAIVLLTGSIGSLKLAPWARQAMLAYASLAVVMGLAGIVIQILLTMPLSLEATRDLPGPAASGAKIGAITGLVVGGVSLLYPVFVLLFFNKANVRAAFERRA